MTHTATGAADAIWVTGTFLVDTVVAEPILSVLEPTLIVRGNVPDNHWLPLSLNLLMAEIAEQQPGNQVTVSRILDLLFIHALRT